MIQKLSREQRLRKTRQMVRVPISLDLLAKHLLNSHVISKLEVAEGIPADSIFITAYNSMETMDTFFIFAHELFEEVAEGSALPIKDIVIKEIYPPQETD